MVGRTNEVVAGRKIPKTNLHGTNTKTETAGEKQNNNNNAIACLFFFIFFFLGGGTEPQDLRTS